MSEVTNKQEAAAIVGKILKLLESEHLTVRDAERILMATGHVLRTVSIPVDVPEDIEWPLSMGLPTMTRRHSGAVH